MRINDYRMVYSIFDQQLVIQVIKIGHRKQIYKRASTITPLLPLSPTNVAESLIFEVCISVDDNLDCFAAGMDEQSILEDHDYLTQDDIRADFAYAADRERRSRSIAELRCCQYFKSAVTHLI